MNILTALASHDGLGDTGRKTGFRLKAFAAPNFVFKDAGAAVTLTSPQGGQPAPNSKSNEPGFQTDMTRRFERDAAPAWAPGASRRSGERAAP